VSLLQERALHCRNFTESNTKFYVYKESITKKAQCFAFLSLHQLRFEILVLISISYMREIQLS